jgi:hypothetical protein
MRFVLDLDSRAHIDPSHLKSLSWLPVHRRVEQIMLCHVFKTKNGRSPDYMCEHFISQDSVHNYSTRLSQKGGYCLPKVKGQGSKSFAFSGIKLWNDLPVELVEINRLQSFKVAIKSHLMNSIYFFYYVFTCFGSGF